LKLLHEQDWIIISPDYHLLPESTTDDIRSDVAALESWVLHNCKEVGIDSNRIGVIGGSAGM
jgi:acetyl esterase/lipase